MANFSVNLQAYADKTGESLATLVQEAVIGIGADIVMRSPVGNPSLWKSRPPAGYAGGRFRGNWQHQFGSPTEEPLDVVDASGASSIARITAGVRGSPAFGVHYVMNNLPYAEVLEEGHSTQAPAGMVKLAVMDFRRFIAKETA